VLSLLKDKRASDKVLVMAYDNLKELGKASSQSGGKSGIGSDGNKKIESQTPNVKNEVQWMNVTNE
jgi:hypothetical protein